jgi:hypothetical protein
MINVKRQVAIFMTKWDAKLTEMTQYTTPLRCPPCMTLPGSMNQVPLCQIPMVCLLQQNFTKVKSTTADRTTQENFKMTALCLLWLMAPIMAYLTFLTSTHLGNNEAHFWDGLHYP